MHPEAGAAVVALLATPYTPQGRLKKDRQKDSNRRFKAESVSLRHSDLRYILDAVRASQSLPAQQKSPIDVWAEKESGLDAACTQSELCGCAGRGAFRT